MAKCLLRDKDQYNCSVCLDLMKDPVTVPCGHSYCMSCIADYWDRTEFRKISCPLCKHEFPKRPALNKNTMLAEILEELRNTTLQDSSPSEYAAGPGEVVCDYCTDRKLRAVRSCLECRVSYCEMHLQPHYDLPALRKHKLVIATNIPMCPKHDKLLEAFCRTDDVCICVNCVLDEHKGHDTVSSEAERDKKQVTLQANKSKLLEKRKEKEEELQKLRNSTAAHAVSTEKLVEDVDVAFSLLITSAEKIYTEVVQRIQAQEEIHKAGAADLEEKLEIEIAMLTGQEEVMDNLLQTEDNIYFLQNFKNIPLPSGAEESPCQTLESDDPFPDVTKMISEFRAKLETFCKQELENMLAKFEIKVGDRVRVKTSVNTPKFNWAGVTHKSVGVVKAVNDEMVIVNFPEYKNWKGILSEMEQVTDPGIQSQERTITVGDRVRVKPSITNPKRSWGRVTHKSVGVIKCLLGDEVTVDFPEHSGWKGAMSEMEIVS